MDKSWSPTQWKAIERSGSWQIVGKTSEIIATIGKSEKSEEYAKLIAASPYLSEALKALVDLIGDEDLPDNGELSGAAICDMARLAIEMAGGEIADT
jgi:hypothetical protein